MQLVDVYIFNVTGSGIIVSGFDNFYLGTDDADELDGNGQNDVIIGAGDDDQIRGQGGRDVMQGGAGADTVLGQGGDDYLIYRLTENIASTGGNLGGPGADNYSDSPGDYYDGGGDTQGEEDKIIFLLSYGEYNLYGAEIASYQTALNDNNHAHGFYYAFSGFNLIVDDIESAEIILTNRGPTANADTSTTNEDTAFVTTADVRVNDTDPDNLDELTITGFDTSATIGVAALTLADGTYSYDPNSKFEYLAVGESTTDAFNYTITDLAGATSTTTVTITITGVNDAPIISVETLDSASETVVETNTTLTTAGTLTVSDIDLTDVVTASVISVSTSGKDNDSKTPTNSALLSMLSLAPTDPAAILDGTENTDSLAWNFNSSGEAFDYLADDENLVLTYTVKALDDNGASDTQTVTITVDGTNDAPIISVKTLDSASKTVVETNATLTTAGTLTVSGVDTTDVVTASVMSVSTSGKDNDLKTPTNSALLSMLSLTPTDPAAILDGTENTDSLTWNFNSSDEAFDYLADDENLVLTYTIKALDDNAASDTQTVTITVDGSNDRPIAKDVTASVGEDDTSVTEPFDASDVDSTDILSYAITSQPTDTDGHQYGSVVNNNNGTFTFMPNDQFQFLEADESRDVSFTYKAIDDSGVAATDTSVEKTATITVNGAYDAPIVINEQVLFESYDQSMWDTGDALIIDWREFYGTGWDESFSQTIVNSGSLTIVPKIVDPIFGETIYGGYSVTSPAVSIGGSTTGRFGISPYFELNSGSVDSNIPVDIDLTYDVQYESGDSISILTGYSVDNAAYFETTSPSITFGIDLVFEFTASGDLNIGSSTFGSSSSHALFPDIDIDIDEPDLPGTDFNLVEFSSDTGIGSDILDPTTLASWLEQDGEGGYIIGHPGFDTNLALSFPTINTTGALTGPNRLESTGSDDFAVLNIDLDEIASEVIPYFPPMHEEGSVGLDFDVDLPGFVNDLGWDDITVDLFSVNWDFELIDIDLISTLTAVQDFTLDIEELPLMVTLENGDIINGFEMGDSINFTLPDWDVDLLGDQDGMMDYSLAIDMDAMLNNWTTLDFSLDILARALKADIGYTSDIVGDDSYSLFGGDNDGFLVAETFELLNVSPLAELFGAEDPAVSGFDLEGFNTPTYDDGFWIA
ncbi:MAG: hypothetical protein GQ581_03060 [Methyloprofundus sp.]|nr:hypothetical protein [Methyloprofundus sp.]